MVTVASAPVGYERPQRIGSLGPPELVEASGLAASARASGLLWAVNDGGHPPELYALAQNGAARARLTVPDATNVDWEDLAGCRCPEGPQLVIADTGDNLATRPSIVVYRIPEPSARPGAAVRGAEATVARFPEGPADVEGLLVDPRRGTVLLLTKSSRRTRAYRLPAGRTDEPVDLVEVAVPGLAPLGPITGAAVSPDGSRIVVRTYFAAYEFGRRRGESLGAALGRTPTRVPLPFELQGEAITYSTGGDALLTTSEGRKAPIWQIARD